jgi:hypothetical protein
MSLDNKCRKKVYEVTSKIFAELAHPPSHEGSCTPESGCDGACVQRTYLAETINRAIKETFKKEA